MEVMRVHYRLHVPPAAAEERAAAIALEQTVEVPRAVVRDPFIEESVMGRVASVAPDGDRTSRAVVDYPVAATALDPAQILNVVFGNSSLHGDVECVDVEFPPSVLAALGGPRFGIEGLRKCAGAQGRPLTCTAVKPMGQSPEALADLFRVFARSGIDFVKDDHGLANHAFCPFEARVRACLAAERETADATGRRAVYVPNLIGPPEAVFRQLDFAESCGARAVMASPMLIGLPTFWELCRRRTSLPVLAHPALGGAAGIAPEALFGRIYRAYGADGVIFVSFGSRFSPPVEACRRLADNLVAGWSGLHPALPVVGGGITVDNAGAVARFYGRDSMLLVGGDLQVDAERVEERCRAFVEAVHGAGDHSSGS